MTATAINPNLISDRSRSVVFLSKNNLYTAQNEKRIQAQTPKVIVIIGLPFTKTKLKLKC